MGFLLGAQGKADRLKSQLTVSDNSGSFEREKKERVTDNGENIIDGATEPQLPLINGQNRSQLVRGDWLHNLRKNRSSKAEEFY
ncbi:hypothetical protein OUZ56_026931 [Daphnia magna]|uniref:Uncharacterized protein n=1 Tax=Daphnia magna TaxID=35525 RepID=A0ABQ9ZN88_9CRUS|nr:hypothetical protein OUZ56_026931 [Daphnia magna]